MLNKLRTKWYLLVVGTSVMGSWFGQCVGDVLEDAIVFSLVD